MRTFLVAVLSVIAVGVMLIAYGLLAPRTMAAPGGMLQYDARGDAYQLARPAYPGDRIAVEDPYAAYPGRPAMAYPATLVRPAPAYQPYTAPARSTRTVTRVERSSGRDWTKTALVIGGSTAAGAGVGAIFGGKTGALIGAAIGGGASTLYEAKKR